MKANLMRTVSAGLCVMLLAASGVTGVSAQAPAIVPPDQTGPQIAPAQLSQVLAPIALYPDALLAQILMASTYPLEVVEADRWLQDPGNARLRGDQLSAALDQQTWDPSVKSLVEFPRVLHMMDQNLDWTEQLGDAFLADQSAVMDQVQRLRRMARAAGKLETTTQQVVSADDDAVIIAPTSPQIVYVPVYDPSLVYGIWAWPGYPPDYFPGFYDDVVFDGFGFGWFGVPIFATFWGWDGCDWRGHRIWIDPDRFAGLNRHHPSVGGSSWQHDGYHRRGVPYADAAISARFARPVGSVGSQRELLGFPAPASGAASARQAPYRPAAQAPRASLPAPAAPIERVAPVVESYGSGADVRNDAARGYGSRMSAPNVQSSRGAPFGGGSSGGGHASSGGGRGPR